MTKKIFLALAALTALTLCFSSCKKDNTGGNKPTPKSEVKLKVEPKDVKVMVGKTAQLTVTVQPADTKYTFESANADIATVSDKGVVTGVKVGKTVISVKAGDVTKTANIEVIDASTLDESRFIGKPDDKGYIAPIYIVEAAKIPDLKEVIKAANESKGWMFDEEFTMENGGKGLAYVAPNDGKQYTDNRVIGEMAYYFFPGNDGNFIMAFMKGTFDEDPVKKVVDGDKDAEQLYFGIAAAYGFDKNQATGTLKGGAPCAIAYNMEQFPEGPYEMMIRSGKTKEGKYYVMFQIVQKAPEAQSSLAQRTPMMPGVKFAPSHLLISNR